ncbi:MAG: AEC family transporter [Eubacterium sp.]|nr:AEC family transporter [Eubacterium sp.]
MENLIYSLNATIPVFIVIVVGYFLKRIGWIQEEFIKGANKINFRLTLPALLIQDLMNTDFQQEFDLKFVFYCAGVTCISFFSCWFFAKFFVRKEVVGEFVQASFRSSAAVLGAAFVVNIYGNTGMVPLMIIGAVPLYNIFSVIVLTVECPEENAIQQKTMKTTLKGIATNPIIIGIIIGVGLSMLKVDFPKVIDNTLGNFARISTPLALLAIGGAFEFGKAMKELRPAVLATFLKLIGFAAIFLPVAIQLGFRDEKLMAIIIMLCSPTTPSCFIMAKSMKSEGTLTSSVVVLATLCSAFTLTAVIFIVKTLGYL